MRAEPSERRAGVPESRLTEYAQLLSGFVARGYQTAPFSPVPAPNSQLLLRHDIDFDPGLALETSMVEDQLGLTATYFFMLRSASYNLLTPSNVDVLRSLQSRGHRISIHFDASIYADSIDGLRRERRLFESFFDCRVDCISIHRPDDTFLGNADEIDGVRHTYQPRYFSQMKYFADSQGAFRYGHPLESPEVAAGMTIHLLIHPVWWVTRHTDPLATLETMIDDRTRRFRIHVAENCIPYRRYLEESRQ